MREAVLRPRIVAEHGAEAFFSTLGNATAEMRARGEGHALGGVCMAVLRYLLQGGGVGGGAEGQKRLDQLVGGAVGTAREEKEVLETLEAACGEAVRVLEAAENDGDAMVVSYAAEKRRLLEGYRSKLREGIELMEGRVAADDGGVTR